MGKALEGRLRSRAHPLSHSRQGLRVQSVSQARPASAHKYSVRKSGEAVCPNHGSVRTWLTEMGQTRGNKGLAGRTMQRTL